MQQRALQDLIVLFSHSSELCDAVVSQTGWQKWSPYFIYLFFFVSFYESRHTHSGQVLLATGEFCQVIAAGRVRSHPRHAHENPGAGISALSFSLALSCPTLPHSNCDRCGDPSLLSFSPDSGILPDAQARRLEDRGGHCRSPVRTFFSSYAPSSTIPRKFCVQLTPCRSLYAEGEQGRLDGNALVRELYFSLLWRVETEVRRTDPPAALPYSLANFTSLVAEFVFQSSLFDRRRGPVRFRSPWNVDTHMHTQLTYPLQL